MERVSTVSNRVAIGVCLAVLAWCIWRAATLPVTAVEARLYDHLVRLPVLQATFQPDAWKGLLYAVFARRTVNLLRLSEFSLRLPSILAAVLYLWEVYQLNKKNLWWVLLVLYPAATAVFVSAGGGAVASALCLLALRVRSWNIAGLCLGLALAASPGWFWMPVAAGCGMLVISREWTRWVQQVGITAACVAFIVLLVPLVHAGIVGEDPGAPPGQIRSVAEILRGSAGSAVYRIAVSDSLRDQFKFYRAKYRERGWQALPAKAEFVDYYLVNPADRHAGRVLFETSSLTLVAALH